MGLDMYLSARKYVSQFFGGVPTEDINEAIRLAGFNPSDFDTEYPSFEIKVTAIYWRKANAIHNWFVKNVQDGIDECQRYSVSKEQLLALQSDCEVVLAFPEKAKYLLPTSSGFFFGGTEFDEWYFAGVKHTRDKIKHILSDPTYKDCDFEYQSSW